MAFAINNLARVAPGVPAVLAYKGNTTDDLQASGFFNPIKSELNVDDIILTSRDGNGTPAFMLRVTAVSPNVTTSLEI